MHEAPACQARLSFCDFVAADPTRFAKRSYMCWSPSHVPRPCCKSVEMVKGCSADLSQICICSMRARQYYSAVTDPWCIQSVSRSVLPQTHQG